jgi:hypothetical protein
MWHRRRCSIIFNGRPKRAIDLERAESIGIHLRRDSLLDRYTVPYRKVSKASRFTKASQPRPFEARPGKGHDEVALTVPANKVSIVV